MTSRILFPILLLTAALQGCGGSSSSDPAAGSSTSTVTTPSKGSGASSSSPVSTVSSAGSASYSYASSASVAYSSGGWVGFDEAGSPGIDGSDVWVEPPPPPLGTGSENNVIQAGTLTAGDYDDHLNPQMYQDYASDYFQGSDTPSLSILEEEIAYLSSEGVPVVGYDGEGSSSADFAASSAPGDFLPPPVTTSSSVINAGNPDMPFVDLNQKISLLVVDANGNPFRGAQIDVLVDGVPMVHGESSVKGEFFIYPAYDELPASFEIAVSYADAASVIAAVDLAQLDESRTVSFTLDADAPAVTSVDVALVMDATGSMGDEMRYLQKELDSIFLGLSDQYTEIDIDVALIVYRDVGDVYVVKDFDFTSDIAQFSQDLNAQGAGGGGDYPEAMDQAFAAANALSWRGDSVKIMLFSADAPPHANLVAKTWQEAAGFRSRQIHVVPIAASGVDRDAEFIMRTLALITQSRYLFLTDDSGVGGGHAEPTIDCYIVTRLDSLLRRVMESLIIGERVEPEASEIIRTSGIYNEGVCEAPPELQQSSSEDVAVSSEAAAE